MIKILCWFGLHPSVRQLYIVHPWYKHECRVCGQVWLVCMTDYHSVANEFYNKWEYHYPDPDCDCEGCKEQNNDT